VREAVRRIGRRSDSVVVMAEMARSLLERVYGLEGRLIQVIPHGVPPIVPRGRTNMKARFGLDGRAVLSTFGFVDPRKGLEYMIRAMNAVVEHHPEALYLIVGRTHPELLRREGERYRDELRTLIRARGLERHVAFVDRYLTQQEIIDHLIASDVYVTPYLDPNQITSGTLSYALGAGKAIISTPYLHAVESLAGGRGVLADFRDSDALAALSLRILGDPSLKEQLERNAYASGRTMAWPVVGERVARLYRDVARTALAAAV
jgi:glycosyltransferase involved in cell wall biosynthesis